MTIKTLISTIKKDSIKDLELKKKNIDNALIVNQLMQKDDYEKKGNIEMYSVKEKGLSNSRNMLISYVDSDIAVITDDDVFFEKNYENKIIQAFKNNKDADIITFNYLKNNKVVGGNISYKHNLVSIMKISSIQIAFRTSVIKKNNIKFNPLFGLGAKFVSGEENIFLRDALKKGLKIIHVPILICSHLDDLTSGETWTRKGVIAKGAFSYKVFGRFYFVYRLYSVIFKYKEYKNVFTKKEFRKLFKQGVIEYKEILKG